MATIKVMLTDGLTIGEEKHLEAELRAATAGDMIEATEESEKPVLTPDGYKILTSPTLAGIHTLRRQVVRIGTYPGPLTMGEIKKLSSRDLDLLSSQAENLQGAVIEGITERGNE
jgi:phage FluMu protein gp41